MKLTVNVDIDIGPGFLTLVKQCMAVDGYTNRSAWFRDVVAEHIAERHGITRDEVLSDTPQRLRFKRAVDHMPTVSH